MVALSLVLAALLAACSGDSGDGADPGTSAAGVTTTGAPATTPATTEAGSAPGTGTLPVPGGAPTSVPTQPGTTISALTGGDPTAFCENLVVTFPASFVISFGGVDDPAIGGAVEVAMAPVLAGPLAALVASAPNELIGPYIAWQDRNAEALAAFDALGVPADRRQAYVAELQEELRRLQSGASEGALFDDLPATAAGHGIDRDALLEAGRAFAAGHGTFDEFFDGFNREVTFTPEVEARIEANFPCAADLANPVG